MFKSYQTKCSMMYIFQLVAMSSLGNLGVVYVFLISPQTYRIYKNRKKGKVLPGAT